MSIRPNEDLSVKISKSSGKLSAYILWLNREGKKQFMRKFGREYNHRDNDHKEKMDVLYKSRSPDVVQHYKNLENSDINSEEAKRKRREKSNSEWRAHSHSNAYRHHQATVEHKQYVQSTLEQERIRRGGGVPTAPKRVYEPNTNIHKNLEIFCKRMADEIATELDLLKDTFYTDPMMFVGVSTTYFCFDRINGDMYPLPLEMSMILFSLQEGLQKVETVDFNLDPAVVLKTHNQEALDTVKEMINREARHAGIPLQNAEIQTEEDMAAHWNRFKQIYEGAGRWKPRLLCEKRVLNQVKSTLRILAEAAQDLAYFNAEILTKFLPIEILAVAMKNAETEMVDVTYSEVHQWFENWIVPRDSHHYCTKVHEKMENPAVRVICQQARGAMALHNLFSFLNMYRILNFHAFYTDAIHNLCDPYRGKTTRMEERFHVPKRDEYLDPSVVPRTGLVDGFIIVPTELEEAEVNPVEVGTILKGFPSHQPRSSRDVDDNSPSSSDDEVAVPHFGGRFIASDFPTGPRSPSPHKPGRENSWAPPPPPQGDPWNSRQDPPRQNYPQPPSPQFGASSTRSYPQNGSRAENSNYYDRDDDIARNLQNVLEFDSDDERGSLRNPPRNQKNHQNRNPSPPRSHRPPSRSTVQRYPARCCWRIIPDSEIRRSELWCSARGAAYDPFDQD